MPSTRAKPLTVRGRIETVFYASPEFSAGRLLDKSGEEIPFAGRVFARKGESIILNGHWSKTAIIVGDHLGIQHCAKKKNENERRTFLSFLLTNVPEKLREKANVLTGKR